MKRPITPAASAGTTASVYALGVSGLIGAMRMPAAPATTALTIQLSSATRSGDTPLTTAPVGVSATALVSSPKRVHRYSTVSTTVSTSTETAR